MPVRRALWAVPTVLSAVPWAVPSQWRVQLAGSTPVGRTTDGMSRFRRAAPPQDVCLSRPGRSQPPACKHTAGTEPPLLPSLAVCRQSDGRRSRPSATVRLSRQTIAPSAPTGSRCGAGAPASRCLRRCGTTAVPVPCNRLSCCGWQQVVRCCRPRHHAPAIPSATSRLPAVRRSYRPWREHS